MTDRAPILVAGAGIGGLAAALAMARAGRPITILEKRAEAAEEGAGIQIGPNGTRILAALGLADHLRPLVAVPDAIRVMDGVTGRLLSRLPLGGDITRRHGAPYWVLHRADLHAALRAAVAGTPRIDLRQGCEVVGADDEAGVISVQLADGTIIRGAALIAADGVWSAVRSRVFGAPPLTFTGKCALRAVIPATALPAALSASDITIWLRPAAHVVHYPVRAGREIAIVAIFDDKALGETWAQPVDAASLTPRIAPFPGPLRALLSVPSAWRQWSLYALAGSTPWVKGRIALLGDAAHPPLPFLAQGGVMALEDAVVLARLLQGADHAQIPERLADYEQQRRARATRVMDASGRNGRIYHLDGIMRLARNAVLQTAPPARLMASYDWLYAWKVDPGA